VQTYRKKCVTLILYGFRDCPAEIVDPNQLQDFTLGRVSKKSAINILAIHQSSVSRNTSEWQRHCTFFYVIVTLVDTYQLLVTSLGVPILGFIEEQDVTS